MRITYYILFNYLKKQNKNYIIFNSRYIVFEVIAI